MRVNSNKLKKTVIPPEDKVTVHNVILLDRSGSMAGLKYENAVKGINLELEGLKRDKNVNFTQTIVEFGSVGEDIYHYFMVPLSSAPNTFFGRGANGMTALFQATGELINKLLAAVPKGDKVLLKIFTDGGENDSNIYWRNPTVLRDLIKKVEEENGFTITFEGTKYDTLFVVRSLGIDVTNTLVHDNTPESIFRNATARVGATFLYAKAVADGEDVKTSFYSKSVD